jgi:hypothetical protein
MNVHSCWTTDVVFHQLQYFENVEGVASETKFYWQDLCTNWSGKICSKISLFLLWIKLYVLSKICSYYMYIVGPKSSDAFRQTFGMYTAFTLAAYASLTKSVKRLLIYSVYTVYTLPSHVKSFKFQNGSFNDLKIHILHWDVLGAAFVKFYKNPSTFLEIWLEKFGAECTVNGMLCSLKLENGSFN